MKVYHEELSDILRYIEDEKDTKLEDKKRQFDVLLSRLKTYKTINEHTRILEIGTGTGWFPILCKKAGLSCKGLEISSQLIEFAHDLGRKNGIEPDIELGNIEETDIGILKYDIIIAESVFEHVEYWEKGIKRIYNALRPGGLFLFVSTNKFALKSGEYNFPLYGWLPDKWRYGLRKSRQGEDIMKLGIDFNQFTYFQLRRFFKKIGFTKVMDSIEYVNPDVLVTESLLKVIFIKTLKTVKPIKPLLLCFMPVTSFLCIK